MPPRIVAFGDNVVDCYQDQGLMYPGGNALNLAVFSRRFGASSAYLGAVGDDAAGRHIRDALQAEGVETDGLRREDGATAFCLIGLEEGERVFLGADLGVSIIEPSEGDLEAIASADAVHTGRSSHIEHRLPDFAARTKLSYDFAVVRDAERITRLAPNLFLAAFSAGDLPLPEAEALARLAHEAGARWVVVTRGADGALLLGEGGVFHAPSAKAEIVDTLGAGDTFIARTLYGLLTDEAPDVLLAAAAREAARTCTHAGGFGHPAPMQVDRSRAKTLEEIYATETTVRA